MKPSVGTDALQRAVEFLQETQLADGSFESFSSPGTQPFTAKLRYHTTFTPALILGAISSVDDAIAQRVKVKLAAWLVSQKSPYWSFNYWAIGAPERERLPYPDDLDDTFCSLIALRQYDASLVDEACLAHVVKLLIATE